MIDYATWCAIREGVASHLTAPQLADSLDLDVKTVRHWMDRPYAPRAPVPRTSKLDPYKGRIVGWLDAHPLTAQQVFQRLRDAGYEGGISIVKDYVHKIRPPRREAFLTLAFAPGRSGPGRLGRIRHDLPWATPAAAFPSSSWCWPGAGRCTSSSRSRKRWSSFWRHTSTPLLPWGCRARSWSIICAVRSCVMCVANRCSSIPAISISPAITASKSSPVRREKEMRRTVLHIAPHAVCAGKLPSRVVDFPVVLP
jgi:hypothetical protein